MIEKDSQKDLKLPFRKYMRPWPIPPIERIGWWIAVCLAIGYGVFVGITTSHFGKTSGQYSDQGSYVIYDEARYWAHGGAPPKDVYGPGRGGACGLWSWTHHPSGATYITAIWMYLGYPGQWAQIDILAFATALVLVALAWRNPFGSVVTGTVMLVLLYFAHGYNAYLALPYEDTWFVTCMYLCAFACMLSRPMWPAVLAAGLAAATCIAMTAFHVAIIASVLIAVHGIGWTTFKTAIAAILAWVSIFIGHLIQVWCHFGWCLDTAWSDYVTGVTAQGGATSLLYRVTNMSFHERINQLREWSVVYIREVVKGEFYPWADPVVWLMLLVCALIIPLTVRGLFSSIMFVGTLWGVFLLHPGLFPPHLHMLPRIVLLVVVGVFIVASARPKRVYI